jgi:hypothetical protein
MTNGEPIPSVTARELSAIPPERLKSYVTPQSAVPRAAAQLSAALPAQAPHEIEQYGLDPGEQRQLSPRPTAHSAGQPLTRVEASSPRIHIGTVEVRTASAPPAPLRQEPPAPQTSAPGLRDGLTGGSSSNPTQQVPAAQLPTVLFVWGPGRIVPVRVTALSITEKLYDATLLNPTHVEAQITLRVLTQDELKYVDGPLGSLANTAYSYSQGLREALAIANLANAVTSIIGMLPV